MNMPARILLVGNDQILLETRASILRHFWTMATTTPPHAVVATESVDMVVLCQTLPEEQRQIWTANLRIASPTLLAVALTRFDAGPRNGYDACVNVDRGPAALVASIYELLTERGLESKLWPDSDASRLWDHNPTSAPN
jgi:hypothetical protein